MTRFFLDLFLGFVPHSPQQSLPHLVFICLNPFSPTDSGRKAAGSRSSYYSPGVICVQILYLLVLVTCLWLSSSLTEPQVTLVFLKVEIALVHSGCYNRLPSTAWLINNQHLFLIVLDAGKSKIKVLADWVSGESLLPSS